MAQTEKEEILLYLHNQNNNLSRIRFTGSVTVHWYEGTPKKIEKKDVKEIKLEK